MILCVVLSYLDLGQQIMGMSESVGIFKALQILRIKKKVLKRIGVCNTKSLGWGDWSTK